MSKDVKPRNKQGLPHGHWEHYYYNGELEFKGKYINGIEDGYFLEHWDNFYHPFFYKYGNRYYKNRNINGEFETF